MSVDELGSTGRGESVDGKCGRDFVEDVNVFA